MSRRNTTAVFAVLTPSDLYLTAICGCCSALAKAGHSVLHVDSRAYYGEDQATLSLKELIDWAEAHREASSDGSVAIEFPSSGSQDLPLDLAQSARRYNVSLCPTIYPSVGPFITSLVRSGVAKYTGFRLVDSIALYHHGQLKPAASTKEDIFKDNTLSLIEKRRVMKFVMAANADDDAALGDGTLSSAGDGEDTANSSI